MPGTWLIFSALYVRSQNLSSILTHISRHDKVAHEQGILSHDGGIFFLSCIRNLVNKTGVSPRYYELTGIDYRAQIDYAGAFSDICAGVYESQKLCIKMIRMSRSDKKKVLKVRRLFLSAVFQIPHGVDYRCT